MLELVLCRAVVLVDCSSLSTVVIRNVIIIVTAIKLTGVMPQVKHAGYTVHSV